jgi:transposase
MANQLKMARIQAILGLLERGWSHRRISRELGVHRETVGRYDRLRREAGSKPAIVTLGSAPRPPGQLSQCAPLKGIILEKLEARLSAQRIWQDLAVEHGFEGSYSSVKRYVRRLGGSTPLPFRRMECAAGQEAQVDFGTGAWVIGQDGKRRRPHLFRIVLSHSRHAHSEVVWRQDTESFLRCLENALRAFGGVPQTVVLDNLKAAVITPDWYDPELNPKLLDFARHYGFVALPARPRVPRHKGKVEAGIKYVKDNALKGRAFSSLAEQNQFLARWERTVADTRIHGTTRKQVAKVFQEVERPALQHLPSEPFPVFHEGERKVNRDGHVEVARAYYSVPPEYLGRTVWARWDARLVRLYNERFEQIAVHLRHEPGRFRTQRGHIADEKISLVEKGAGYMLGRARLLGEDAHAWTSSMIEARGIEGVRVLQGFLSLANRYPAGVLNRASQTALEARCFRLRLLRQLSRPKERQHESPADHQPQTAAPVGHDRHPGGPPAGSPGQSVKPPRAAGVAGER